MISKRKSIKKRSNRNTCITDPLAYKVSHYLLAYLISVTALYCFLYIYLEYIRQPYGLGAKLIFYGVPGLVIYSIPIGLVIYVILRKCSFTPTAMAIAYLAALVILFFLLFLTY